MSYADALESYLVPVEEAAGNKALAIAITAATFAAIGIPNLMSKMKREKDAKARQEAESKLEAELAEKNYEAWKNDPNTKKAIEYVNRKYGVDYDNLDGASKNKMRKKIYDLVMSDVIRISKKMNADKKMCNALADQAKKKDPTLSEDELDDIRNGICSTHPIDYGDGDNEVRLDIFEAAQFARYSVDDYYGPAFTKALNIKYSNEIIAKIITEFEISYERGILEYIFTI